VLRLRILAVVAVAGATFGAAPARAANGCRGGNPMANVYAPSRLKVLSNCRTVSGTVVSSETENDGDEHLSLRVDRQYASMLNAGNHRHHGNTLVLEIVPADQPGCVKGRKVRNGVCTGAHVAIPKNGSHITATGPFVLDRPAGWNEIHPVWQIR